MTSVTLIDLCDRELRRPAARVHAVIVEQPTDDECWVMLGSMSA